MYGKGILKGLSVTWKRFWDTYIEDISWLLRGKKRYFTEEGIKHRSSKDTKGIFTIQYPEERLILPEGLPGHDKIAVAVHRHRRSALDRRRGGVDAEFPRLRHTRRAVALRVDAIKRTILCVTFPCDDKIAGAVDGDRRRLLIA